MILFIEFDFDDDDTLHGSIHPIADHIAFGRDMRNAPSVGIRQRIVWLGKRTVGDRLSDIQEFPAFPLGLGDQELARFLLKYHAKADQLTHGQSVPRLIQLSQIARLARPGFFWRSLAAIRGCYDAVESSDR